MKVKKFNQLNEGTWALVDNKHLREEKGRKYITKLEKFKKEIHNDFGDDSLFDELDGAIKRIEELMEIQDKK